MKETLEGEFPKMVRFVNDLWKRLCQSATTYLVADASTLSRYRKYFWFDYIKTKKILFKVVVP